jgi:hypothetical protein
MFVDIIPAEFRFDAGYVTSDDAESVIDAAWDVG